MSEENKKGFIVEANTVLSRYVGKINEKRVLDEISKELDLVLNKYIEETPMYKDDFPIEFENQFGEWKIESDGSTQYKPRVSQERLLLNITINKTEESDRSMAKLIESNKRFDEKSKLKKDDRDSYEGGFDSSMWLSTI